MTMTRPAEETCTSTPSGVLPLCVDLDGTLLHIDTLQESTFAAAFDDWRILLRLPGWLMEGKAKLKLELAKRWRFDPGTLPYNADLLKYIRAEHEAGRRLVLCTAADRSIAERIAEYLGLFDEVIAGDGQTNLRGGSKAEALRQRFGAGGFVYAGNDSTDFPVWDSASEAVVVNAPRSVLRAARSRYQVAATFNDRGSTVRALVRAMRPYQWVKNLLCFVPSIAAGDFSAHGWVSALAIASAFCFVASGFYILNDISDLAADRTHPRKSLRPFASGNAPIAAGLTLVPATLLAGAFLGAMTNGWLALVIYLAVSLAYNFRLKEKPLIDVFTLAALYTLRLFGGSLAGGHGMSLWLLAFSSFLFLSLAIIKRVSELRRLRGSGSASRALRRGYANLRRAGNEEEAAADERDAEDAQKRNVLAEEKESDDRSDDVADGEQRIGDAHLQLGKHDQPDSDADRVARHPRDEPRIKNDRKGIGNQVRPIARKRSDPDHRLPQENLCCGVKRDTEYRKDKGHHF
jgi:phosphoserine phosphatase